MEFCIITAIVIGLILWAIFSPTKKPEKPNPDVGKSPQQLIFESYLDNIFAYLDNKKMVKNPYTGEYEDPSETFMREIEEGIGVPEQGADDFRRSMAAFVAMTVQHKGSEALTWHSNSDMEKAINAYIVLCRP